MTRSNDSGGGTFVTRADGRDNAVRTRYAYELRMAASLREVYWQAPLSIVRWLPIRFLYVLPYKMPDPQGFPFYSFLMIFPVYY